MVYAKALIHYCFVNNINLMVMADKGKVLCGYVVLDLPLASSSIFFFLAQIL